MTRLGPLLAAGAAAVLVLSACGPDGDPKPNFSSVSPTASASTPSPSPTGSPSPTVPTTGPNVSPGEVPPTPSSLSGQHTQEGALAFAAYYYRMSDWAFATSDFGVLDPFFASTCSVCSSAQSNLKSLVSNGQYFTGGRITTNSLSVVPADGRAGAEIAIQGQFSVAAADLRNSAGDVVRSEPADPSFGLTDYLGWTEDGGWQIVDEVKS